ncbi:MAG: hypothetical protein WCQ21_18500, partial [Verrucomicrobiota bacterium]
MRIAELMDRRLGKMYFVLGTHLNTSNMTPITCWIVSRLNSVERAIPRTLRPNRGTARGALPLQVYGNHKAEVEARICEF